jgi:hypothetical protein
VAYTPSFVNFSRYLGANRGAAENTAQGLINPVNEQGDDVINRLNGAASDFNAGAAKVGGINPTNGALLDPNTQRSYTGAASLADAQGSAYDTMLADAQSAQDKAATLGTESGVRTALQEKQGASPYSAAASRFDAGLVSGVAQPQLSEISSRYSNLTQRVRDANTDSQAVGAAAKAQGDTNEKQYRDMLTGMQPAAGTPKPLNVGSTVPHGRPAYLPETKEQNQQRAVSPLGYFNSGAAGALKDTLGNYNTYRQTAENDWRRENRNPFTDKDNQNPFTAQNTGKKPGVLGRYY